jgi:hypothetical protein
VMYELWNEIHPIHNAKDGSALFCSGRSPLLYLMGQGRFSEIGVPLSRPVRCPVHFAGFPEAAAHQSDFDKPRYRW